MDYTKPSGGQMWLAGHSFPNLCQYMGYQVVIKEDGVGLYKVIWRTFLFIKARTEYYSNMITLAIDLYFPYAFNFILGE